MPHVKSHALTGEKPCINKAIHALLMHGFATFNMPVPGPQKGSGLCQKYPVQSNFFGNLVETVNG